MDPRDRMAFLLQHVVEPLGIDSPPREHQRASQFLIEEHEQRGALVLRLHDVQAMPDADGSAGRGDVDAHRIAHELAGDHLDRIGHRRREHHGLARAREPAEHVADLGEKSEVEHVVCFVKDQLLDGIERQVSLAEMIEQPARRGYEDVGRFAEGLSLRPYLHAADQADGAQRVVRAEDVEKRFGLQGDLARRREDQSAQASAVREALGDRKSECGGLAGSGLGQADDIASGHRNRNDRRLDRRGMDEADLLHGRDDRVTQSELGELLIGRLDRMLRNAFRNHPWNTFRYTAVLITVTTTAMATSIPRVRPWG